MFVSTALLFAYTVSFTTVPLLRSCCPRHRVLHRRRVLRPRRVLHRCRTLRLRCPMHLPSPPSPSPCSVSPCPLRLLVCLAVFLENDGLVAVRHTSLVDKWFRFLPSATVLRELQT
ncbi:hypothetical protein PF007_g28898 [Phytophthora fragariae]|uniref:Secreted protein n=1 Tax=Phytophthora fragariae TaxID=53985 RepID=A0A6A3PYN1_9STRA|nr:hypothetical protein PF003_g26444 [Phytophthora fragariae]KAE8920984.1 hypothetical protein PF009_g28729 [Phytophthora fragariae]KAE9065270.1 hypothetical protein PF007_g28898 [Phytophthora fragariae]